MKALSIRQPWAWLIVNGYKDIENRTWATNFRGTVLIHAAKSMTKAEYEQTCEYAAWCTTVINEIEIPDFGDMLRGGVVGHVDVVDCVTESKSPWFDGPYGFVLRHPIAYECFAPYPGRLGFFDVKKLPFDNGARSIAAVNALLSTEGLV